MQTSTIIVADAAQALATSDPALIDSSVDGVMFRFALQYRNQISPALWLKETLAICGEGSSEPAPRRQRNKPFIEPTLNVGTYAFFHEICDAEFVMTQASPQEWLDKYRGPCFAVKFIFNRMPLRYPVEPALQRVIDQYGRPSLVELSKKSAWQVEAYRNALRTEGRFGMSINCVNPVPLQKGVSRFLRLADNRIVLE